MKSLPFCMCLHILTPFTWFSVRLHKELFCMLNFFPSMLLDTYFCQIVCIKGYICTNRFSFLHLYLFQACFKINVWIPTFVWLMPSSDWFCPLGPGPRASVWFCKPVVYQIYRPPHRHEQPLGLEPGSPWGHHLKIIIPSSLLSSSFTSIINCRVDQRN